MFKQHQQGTNTAIISSIPLNRKMKTFFVKKYGTMVKCNGSHFASERFKSLKETLMAYRSDLHRLERRDEYIRQAPFKESGWLRMLFDYMDTCPHYTLDFVKLYCGFHEPVVTPEESADDFHQVLLDIDRRADRQNSVPKFLTYWLRTLRTSLSSKRAAYWAARRNPGHPYHRYCSYHELNQWMDYWKTWHGRLLSPIKEEKSLDYFIPGLAPQPAMYRDYDGLGSASFDADLKRWLYLSPEAGDCFGYDSPVSAEAYYWLQSHLANGISDDLMYGYEYDRDYGFFAFDEAKQYLSSTPCVGEVHHIPKKGTVGRRPIAVPNRFIQLGLTPYNHYLHSILKRLDRDATYNQTKFTRKNLKRINTGNYLGSVDLSKATDNLPLSWFEKIEEFLNIPSSMDIQISRDLFYQVARGPWRNGSNISRWTVGQPLGTLPSFPILGLTHNLFLESLALKEGYGHSPYCILGDDVLISKKRLRNSYIQQMTGRGIPLSLHKSYEHNLVEFAGQVLIKNQPARYISDHSVITWNNLFDYQRATGVEVKYEYLPKQIRGRIAGYANKASLRSKTFYQTLQELIGIRLTLSGLTESIGSSFFCHLAMAQDELEPTRLHRSPIVPFVGGPIQVVDVDIVRKQDNVPEWYKQKFRPAPTDALARTLLHAVRDLK